MHSQILPLVAIFCFALGTFGADRNDYATVNPKYSSLDEHVIRIDPDGTFADKRVNPQQALRKLFDAVKASGKKRIALYIHGGRRTMHQAIDTACRLGPVIFNDGEHCAYPIFICWESGDLSSYGAHLAFERNGVSYHHSSAAGLAAVASPLVLAADLGRGASRIPINTVLNFGKLLQNSDLLVGNNSWAFPIKKKYEQRLAQYVGGELNVPQKIKNGFVYPPQMTANDRLQISLGRDAQHYQLKFVSHQLATIPLQITSEALLDTIGTAEWSNMVGRTRTMFHPSSKYVPQSSSTGETKGGAGTMFFRELDKFLRANEHVKLDIYAHSMGAMVTNEAFAQFPDLRASNIVFMAAACSIHDFGNTTGRHIAHCRTPFYNLSLHPRVELDEVEVFGVPVRGSLLTWIDEFFESPSSFGNRTLGTFENVIIASDQLPGSTTIHLKAFPIEDGSGKKRGYYAGPQKHGEFDEYYFWRPDFRAVDTVNGRYPKIPKNVRCCDTDARTR